MVPLEWSPSRLCRKVRPSKTCFFHSMRDEKDFKSHAFWIRERSRFYTTMIQTLRRKWIELFTEIRDNVSITTSHTTLICDDKIIINDILLFVIIFQHSCTIFLMLSRFLQSIDGF